MLQAFFHAWERRLSDVTKDRVVRPFEWGLDWLPAAGGSSAAQPFGQSDVSPDARAGASQDARGAVQAWVSRVMADTDAFFTPPPTMRYRIDALEDGERMLAFPSALVTPHDENNTVYCRVIAPKKTPQGPRAAVLVLPQWNSNATGHLGLARLLAMNGMTALRLSLPYHDRRMPPELARADYIVSSNVVRTVQSCRQAVLDARRAIAWLANEGYERIGILGSSLGSCLALLTAAHEPLIRAQALNHISPHFADVVWRGISTRHVRTGLDGHIELDVLRELWKPISPQWYLERLHEKKTLLVYARYDLTFPRDLSEDLVQAFRELNVPHELAVLPCGHYTTGKAPFKFLDGWILTRFLKQALS